MITIKTLDVYNTHDQTVKKILYQNTYSNNATHKFSHYMTSKDKNFSSPNRKCKVISSCLMHKQKSNSRQST